MLIYGAGIIGSTYGWQLSKVGHDISVLVRKDKKQFIEENGIPIHCTDFRDNQKRVEQFVFRPKVIDTLSADNDFEYIIVATNNLYLKDILPVLKQSAGSAHILFFQNMWDDFDEIAKYLTPDQYFFGFPFMVGGGRDKEYIHSAISGLKFSHTPIGEAGGEITPRIEKMVKTLDEANLKPVVYKHITTWLITHYAIAAGLSAGIIKAGGGKAFARNTTILREAIKSIREGLLICTKRGIDVKADKPNKLYSLPLWISVPIAKKIYSNDALEMMFDGHTKHSPDEMKKMLADIIESGKKYNVDTPYLKCLQKDVIQSLPT